ncbi:hypothetical protein BC936DRAFT_142744 [Jimgerdemannia flammicorona]|uniref:Uncharacterized protein n=1 Tax=Jimgerdemannia flammicorona TaxID=994334 RepID=A0A433DEW3_9FUNG|nr:hypothetical protein BC936DRAFT_142744 [Jimgerdemannia flammicorona]
MDFALWRLDPRPDRLNGKQRRKIFGIALYWVGIVQTLPEVSVAIVLKSTRLSSSPVATTHSHAKTSIIIFQTHKVSRTWLPTAAQVDVMGCFLVFGPMLTNNICSILAGHFGDIGNLQMAQMFIRLHYACWTIFDTTLAVSLIYFGTRLTTVLRDHLNNVNVLGSRRARILRLGLFKIQIVLVSVAACLIAFAGMLLSYCLWRKEIHTITPVSLFVGTCWTLTAVFMSLAVFISTLLRNSRDASPEAPEVSQSTESRSTHQPPSSTASSDKTTEGHEHVVTIPDEKAGRDAPEDRSHSLSPICWMPTRPQVAPSGRRGSKSSGIELVQQRPESQTSDDDLPGQV